MQVFGLRLGKSTPGADPARIFTLEELEDELGAALMESDPAMSQLYVHTIRPPLGKGWRVSRHFQVAVRLAEYPFSQVSLGTAQLLTATRDHLVTKTLQSRSCHQQSWMKFFGADSRGRFAISVS